MAAECRIPGGAGRGKRPQSPKPKAERVVLIGYRASGKTSVGQVLAARLGWRFADTDAEVEGQAGRSIAEIVAAEGWPGFRAREREAVGRLCAEKQLVIAAGGGAVLDPANRDEFKRGAVVVYVKSDAATLASRLAADPLTASQRPGLTGADALGEVEQVLGEREPIYEAAADWRIEAAGRGIGEIAAEIGRLIEDD
jgi:shikimate kinase